MIVLVAQKDRPQAIAAVCLCKDKERGHPLLVCMYQFGACLVQMLFIGAWVREFDAGTVWLVHAADW